jgi:hypothetical protein
MSEPFLIQIDDEIREATAEEAEAIRQAREEQSHETSSAD